MRRTIANIFLKTRMSKIDFVWVSSRSWLKVYELRTFTFIVSRFLRVLYGEFARENVQEFELSSKNLTVWVSQAISHLKSRLIYIKSAVFPLNFPSVASLFQFTFPEMKLYDQTWAPRLTSAFNEVASRGHSHFQRIFFVANSTFKSSFSRASFCFPETALDWPLLLGTSRTHTQNWTATINVE